MSEKFYEIGKGRKTASVPGESCADGGGGFRGGKILCVTNRKLCREDFLVRVEAAARVLAGGSGGIILREKDLPEPAYRELAGRVMEICERYGTRCILHNFAGTAAELGAQAVHLPLPVLRGMRGSVSVENREKFISADNAMDAVSAENRGKFALAGNAMDAASAKNREKFALMGSTVDVHCVLSQFRILGASCHSVEDALEAQSLGCTYITAGHIFATDCKRGAPPRGLSFLREVCESVSIPVYAIGGINGENYPSVLEAGAAGACIMSGLMCCGDAEEYMRSFV